MHWLGEVLARWAPSERGARDRSFHRLNMVGAVATTVARDLGPDCSLPKLIRLKRTKGCPTLSLTCELWVCEVALF